MTKFSQYKIVIARELATLAGKNVIAVVIVLVGLTKMSLNRETSNQM